VPGIAALRSGLFRHRWSTGRLRPWEQAKPRKRTPGAQVLSIVAASGGGRGERGEPLWKAAFPGGVRPARGRVERIAFPSARRPEEPLWKAAFPGANRATDGPGRGALTGTGIDGTGVASYARCATFRQPCTKRPAGQMSCGPCGLNGRGGRIRTADLLVPNQMPDANRCTL
jgi:hypothetical protein